MGSWPALSLLVMYIILVYYRIDVCLHIFELQYCLIAFARWCALTLYFFFELLGVLNLTYLDCWKTSWLYSHLEASFRDSFIQPKMSSISCFHYQSRVNSHRWKYWFISVSDLLILKVSWFSICCSFQLCILWEMSGFTW